MNNRAWWNLWFGRPESRRCRLVKGWRWPLMPGRSVPSILTLSVVGWSWAAATGALTYHSMGKALITWCFHRVHTRWFERRLPSDSW